MLQRIRAGRPSSQMEQHRSPRPVPVREAIVKLCTRGEGDEVQPVCGQSMQLQRQQREVRDAREKSLRPVTLSRWMSCRAMSAFEQM
ncbi:MAG: hypothetical protein IPG72_16270 [Ardenticatenales bacterium]|nr:hypothetical protein [Ardenticatenales bacterium]